MDQVIQSCLCKQVCAAGLPKAQALPIVNQIALWCDRSGIEWTVERLKGLHHWYETRLAGHPNIPSYMRKCRGVPKGVFGKVFRMKNHQNALAILSVHTVFLNSKVTQKQWDKLYAGLESHEVERIPSWTDRDYGKTPKRVPLLKYHSPTVDDIVGGVKTVPIGVKRIHPYGKAGKPDLRKIGQAYLQSWMTVPHATVMFVERMLLQEHTPSLYDEVYWATFREEDRPVGIVSCLQEPSLKARWIAMPNKVTQSFLKPLKQAWEKKLKQLPTDCTYEQGRGTLWAQDKMKQGVELVGVDLTSASDKLSLLPCLDLIHQRFYGATVSNGHGGWNLKWYNSPEGKEYLYAVIHFAEISRGKWSCHGGKVVSWNSGNPLGSYPSFALLGLTNNTVAWLAHKQAERAGLLSVPWQDSFRVIGDDIVMRKDLYPFYTKLITSIGGEINFDKTISGKAVEFAGRIITKDEILLKRVVSREISDNSFMSLVAKMGEQSSSLLRPRQRKVWKELRFVPGVVVEGEYSRDGYGEPLHIRYLWYLLNVAKEKIKPDVEKFDGHREANKLLTSIKQDPKYRDSSVQMLLPRDLWEGYQPSKSDLLDSQGGDPRMVNGKTFLEAMESLIQNGWFQSYREFKKTHQTIWTNPDDQGQVNKLDGNKLVSSNLTETTSVPKRRKGR